MTAQAIQPTERVATRPLRFDDAADVAALVTEATSDWLGWPATTPESVLHSWRAPGVELTHDGVVAYEGDDVIGYAFVLPGRRSRSTFWLEVWAGSAAEESTTASDLLAALQPRIAALAARTSPVTAVRLRLQVEERHAGLREALEEQGFTVVRSPLLMVTDLDGGRAPEWPDGTNVRTFVPADAPAVHAFETEMLGDTWEFVPEPFETWVAQTEAASFDPSLWWMVERNGDLVGVMLARVDSTDPELGWLHVIGVSSTWRGRALGRALVQHALHELEGRGMRRAGLGVDAENPTGACELARRNGFRIAQRFWTYEQRVRGPQPLRRLLHGARHVVSGRSRR